MNKTIAATITAIAIAVSAPFTFAQTAPQPNTAPPVATPSEYQMGPGMMTNQYQTQRQGQAQGQNQDSGYGAGMMGGYGFGWMGGYGGMWLVILLILALFGVGAWVITQKKK
jgi:hypothetical protein